MMLADEVRWLVRDDAAAGRLQRRRSGAASWRRSPHGAPASCAQRRNVFVTRGRSACRACRKLSRRQQGRPAEVARSARVLGAQRLLALAQTPLRLHPDGKAQWQVASAVGLRVTCVSVRTQEIAERDPMVVDRERPSPLAWPVGSSVRLSISCPDVVPYDPIMSLVFAFNERRPNELSSRTSPIGRVSRRPRRAQLPQV